MAYHYTPATKTLDAIEAAIEKDQGTRFRQALQYYLPRMADAYQETKDPHRSHFGFSNAADECARKLWYSFKWAKSKKFKSRILRLFNRGHLEEARFLAMLSATGYEVHFETPEGGQFKIEDHNGHAGSAIDGVILGIPDLEPNTPCLLEMKTHSKKKFTELVKKGVKDGFPVHYGQCQIYMVKYDLPWCLYMGVCKDDDALHLELLVRDQSCGNQLIERSGLIIYSDKAPPRLNESPSWYACKFCDYTKICHQKEVPAINCRTCIHSTPIADKEWHCSLFNTGLTKQNQLGACHSHLFNPELLNGAKVVKGSPEEEGYTIHWKDHRITLGLDDAGIQNLTSQDLSDGKL